MKAIKGQTPKSVPLFFNIFMDMLHHCHLLLFPGPSNRMRKFGLAD